MSGHSKMGRPSVFTPELAETICALICEGQSLRSICQHQDMPDKATVFRWLEANNEFRDQYARARVAQADTFAEEILDIADETSADQAHVALSKLRIDTRKWVMSKTAPKKYGEKFSAELSSKVENPLDGIAYDKLEQLRELLIDAGAESPLAIGGPDGGGKPY